MILKGHNYTITVTEKGAELTSLKKNGVNYLWTKNRPFWQRHAPVLFPIVGKLKDNTYYYEAKKYSLPQHGFARDNKFELVEASANKLLYRLLEKSEEHYPFNFEFFIGYELSDAGLKTTYTIENKGNIVLPFSVGAHPAFICPFYDEEKLEDYYFEFENDFKLHRTLLENGLLSDKNELVSLTEHKLYLSESLFRDDALVLSNFSSKWVALKSTNYILKVSWDDCTFLGLWKQPGAPFVCIEPWWGVADSVLHNQDIISKKGINLLAPGESRNFNFCISIAN